MVTKATVVIILKTNGLVAPVLRLGKNLNKRLCCSSRARVRGALDIEYQIYNELC